MNDAANDTRDFIEKLDREQEMCLSLRELSSLQREVIENEAGVEDLLEVLARKQALIDELDCVERELAPLKKGWEDTRAATPQDVRVQIEGRLRHMREVLRELLDIEDEGRTALQDQREDLAAEMQEIAQSRAAQRAYAKGERRPRLKSLVEGTG